MPELRKDPVIGRWVIIATERAQRPSDFHIPEGEFTINSGRCPFCEGNEALTPPEILCLRERGTAPNTPGWWVRTIPNKFPALRIEGELNRQGEGIYDMMNGVGAHEIVIETPNHHKSLEDLETDYVEKVLLCYRERMIDLKKDTRFKYILVFRNHRSSAGASLDHPHSQLIATPIVPKRVKEELRGALSYYNFKDRCVFCDIVHQEIRDNVRLVMENEHFITFSPYASRFPYEICILPKTHCASYETIDKEQIPALAQILKISLLKLKKLLNDPPYNYIIHTTPFSLPGNLKDYHWHIEIIPRITHVAGFEWGTGFYINTVIPEDAAKNLREIEG
ncbi:MAG: galactose-1-phosphate uridylyltransferase [bacterium]